MKQSKKLEITLLNYFLLIAIAAMMIGVEFYFEMGKPGMTEEICSAPYATTDEPGNLLSDEEDGALSNLRNKIVVMFGVLTLVVAIVMLMFVKNITNPLQRTLNTARQINDGDLSQVIDIQAHDEVGQLGVVINELTSNFQEIATTTLVMLDSIEQKLEKIDTTDEQASKEQLKMIQQELGVLRGFVTSFNLLQTDLDE